MGCSDKWDIRPAEYPIPNFYNRGVKQSQVDIAVEIIAYIYIEAIISKTSVQDISLSFCKTILAFEISYSVIAKLLQRKSSISSNTTQNIISRIVYVTVSSSSTIETRVHTYNIPLIILS